MRLGEVFYSDRKGHDLYYWAKPKVKRIKCLIRGYCISGRSKGRFDDHRCIDCRSWVNKA